MKNHTAGLQPGKRCIRLHLSFQGKVKGNSSLRLFILAFGRV